MESVEEISNSSDSVLTKKEESVQKSESNNSEKKLREIEYKMKQEEQEKLKVKQRLMRRHLSKRQSSINNMVEAITP